MTPLTDEWIAKAEADHALARRELGEAQSPNFDAICFHAQQSAEKYLKAILQEQVVPVPRTHDLIRVLDLLAPPLPALDAIRTELAVLSQLAVSTRYPGYFADAAAARAALATAEKVRMHCRELLGLAA